MFRIFLLVLGAIFVPFFYLGFGCEVSIRDWYKDLWKYYKSGEPFGIFG